MATLRAGKGLAGEGGWRPSARPWPPRLHQAQRTGVGCSPLPPAQVPCRSLSPAGTVTSQRLHAWEAWAPGNKSPWTCVARQPLPPLLPALSDMWGGHRGALASPVANVKGRPQRKPGVQIPNKSGGVCGEGRTRGRQTRSALTGSAVIGAMEGPGCHRGGERGAAFLKAALRGRRRPGGGNRAASGGFRSSVNVLGEQFFLGGGSPSPFPGQHPAPGCGRVV